MKKELTCIICPIGCSLVAETDGTNVISVTGNSCPRGKAYAETECISPMRTITTTVISKNGEPICVKTDRPIPKDKVFDAMKIINQVRPDLPISIGDVIIADVFGSNIVATKNAGGEYENNCCCQK